MITLAYIAPSGILLHMSYPDAKTTISVCRFIAATPSMQPVGIHFPDLASLRAYTDLCVNVEPFDRAAIAYADGRAAYGPAFGLAAYGVRAWWLTELTYRGCVWPDECPVSHYPPVPLDDIVRG